MMREFFHHQRVQVCVVVPSRLWSTFFFSPVLCKTCTSSFFLRIFSRFNRRGEGEKPKMAILKRNKSEKRNRRRLNEPSDR